MMNFEVLGQLLRFDIRHSEFGNACFLDCRPNLREKEYFRICQTSAASPAEPVDLPTD